MTEPTTSTATPALIIPLRKLEEIERISKEFGLAKATADGVGELQTAFMLATGIEQLNQALTVEVMAPLMSLQNTKLGFLTDKPNGGYPAEVVKRCIIEGLLRGVRPVCNELNIIAGGFYATREAFTRLLKEFQGLTDLEIDLGIPTQVKDSQSAVVEFKATWKLKGKPAELSARIPVRVNSGMGPDAVLGKADRKGKARIYWRLTGSESTVPEGEVEVTKNVTPGSAGASGLDTFAASGPVVDLPSQETPWRQEDEVQRHPEEAAAPAGDPVGSTEFLPPARYEGLRRFAKQAKLSDEDLQNAIAQVTERPFDQERIPTALEPRILFKIKELAKK